VVYRARYDLLGSGQRPLVDRGWGELIDEVDVADLESEQAHSYRRTDARARFDVARVDRLPGGTAMADGGRIQRAEERFVMAGGPPSVLVLRVRCEHDVIVFDGANRLGVAEVTITRDPWDELMIEMPAAEAPRWVTVRCMRTAERLERFDSYHYWLFERR
jgi:hypothetical protein